MLGWSRQNLRLSHRLWLAFLITFFYLILFRPFWSTYLLHPFQYPYELLQVVGNILFVELCSGLTVTTLFEAFTSIGYKIDTRKRDKLFVTLEYPDHLQGCFMPLVNVLVFLTALMLAPEWKLPWWAAPMGLLFNIIMELFTALEDTSSKPQQYASIELREDWDLVNITVQTSRDVLTGTLQANWTDSMAYLMNNEWELIATNQVDVRKGRNTIWQRTALFRRPWESIPLFNDWHGKVEKFLPKHAGMKP